MDIICILHFIERGKYWSMNNSNFGKNSKFQIEITLHFVCSVFVCFSDVFYSCHKMIYCFVFENVVTVKCNDAFSSWHTHRMHMNRATCIRIIRSVYIPYFIYEIMLKFTLDCSVLFLYWSHIPNDRNL